MIDLAIKDKMIINNKPKQNNMNKNKTALIFLVFFLLFHIEPSIGQDNKIQKNKYTKQIETLKEDYSKAQGKDSVKYAKLFFAAFPHNFSSFNSIYGYSDKAGAMPLYGLYLQHIDYFCKLNAIIPSKIYFNKLVKLGINGKWDADAVGLIQDCILSHANEKPNLIVTLLKQYNEKEIRSFWRFLFDGPHPNSKGKKSQYNVLHRKIELIDKKMANMMRNEYSKLVKDSKD
jgi:hypothetical protein